MEEIMSSQALEFDVKKPNGTALERMPSLLEVALQNNAAIDVIERLAAIQEKAMDRDAEQRFNTAMNRAQSEIGRIAPDLTNPQTHSQYASYAKLDRTLRPIYTKHGFSLSFDEGECDKPDTVRVVCYCSHEAGHTRKYHKDMPADGKGAKGGDVMTKTHASGAADTYGMRYILKKIFNVAIGEEDNDGNGAGLDDVSERIEFIQNCRDFNELKGVFKTHYTAAKDAKDNRAEKQIVAAYEARKKELNANR
jgi:hypothetical protein